MQTAVSRPAPQARFGSEKMAWALIWGAGLALLLLFAAGREIAIDWWLIWLLALTLLEGLNKPERAICIFAFAIPFEFVFYAWGVGRYNMLTYPALGLLALWMVTRPKFFSKISGQEWLWVALVGWAVVSTLWSQRAWSGMTAIFSFAGAMAVMTIYAHVVRTGRGLLNVLWFLVAGVLSLAAVLAPFYGRTAFNMREGEAHWNAFGGADNVSPYEFGSAALIACLGALALSDYETTVGRRMTARIIAILLAALVLLSLGRTDAIALIIAAVAFVAFPPNRKASRLRRLAVVLGAVVIAYVGVMIVNRDAMSQRWFMTRDMIETGNLAALTSGRTGIWSVAVEIAKQHPVTGIGIGQFSAAYMQVSGSSRATHSAFLQFLVETGVVGFAIFVLFGLWWLIAAWQARGWRHITLTWWSYFMLESFFHGFGRNKVIWLAAGLTIVLAQWAQRERAQRTAARQLKDRALTIAPATSA